MNVFSFLTMNIKGDDDNVFPYIADSLRRNRQKFDCSKLAQWDVVFEHADHLGMYLHFKTQETENGSWLDSGDLGLERKVYYRELIARFSYHLALNWNIGEESVNPTDKQIEFADFFRQVDPYTNHVVIHSYPDQIDQVFDPLIGHPSFTGMSIQTEPELVFNQTLFWRTRSAEVGLHKWVVTNDEQNPARVGVLPDLVDANHDEIRQDVLWGNLMAGGGGVEYYFG